MSDDDEALRAVLEHMPESVAVYDLDATVRYANPATERAFGMTLAQMRGRTLWSLFPDAVGNPFYRAFARAAAGGEAEVFDHYYRPFDRWFANRVERRGDRVTVVARDVTDDVRRRLRLEAIARISAVLTAADLDLREALRAIAGELASLLGGECVVRLLSPDGAWLELAAHAPNEAGPTAPVTPRLRADVGHFAVALRTRAAQIADADAVDATLRALEDPAPREALARYRGSSVVIAPLLVGDDAIGSLTVARRAGATTLGDADRTLISEMAPAVGLYIAHARRRAEADSLRRRLESVADATPALVAFVDGDARCQYVNAAYARWFGRPRAELGGARLADALPPELRAVMVPGLARGLAGETVRFQGRLALPDGDRDVEGLYEPVRGPGGEVDGVAALLRDVTAELRAVEQEQRRLEAERRVNRRLESLLSVTGRLAAALSADEIARAVIDEGVAAVDADIAGLWLREGDGLTLQRARGFHPALSGRFTRAEATQPGPLVDCLATGHPVWVESRADYAARYPAYEAEHRHPGAPPIAFANLPVVIEGRVEGVLNFSFRDERRMSADERTYLEVLASHTAEALRRARLYAELRDVSEVREAMIQSSPAAIMLLDEAGVVQAWNPAAEEIFGWSAAEVLGRPLPVVDAAMREGFDANLRRVLGGSLMRGVVARTRRRDGAWIEVEVHAAPVRRSDGRVLCQSMVLDIGERRRLERARALVSQASAILTRSLDWEQTLAQVVALPVGALADGCAVELRTPVEARITAGVDPSSPGVRAALTVPLAVADRPLGSLTVALRGREFDDFDRATLGELASHAAVAIDNARLYHEARAARSEAEAASRAKDQFLAVLGHELRNPLAPIATALHLMRLRAPEHVDRESAVIERQVTHLSRLIDDLLDVSRVTHGKIALRRAPVEVAELVARAIEMVSPLLEQRAHALRVEVPRRGLVVHADATRLAQVLSNLLTNAAKYTEPGGSLEVIAAADGGDAVIRVRDSGVGISPEMLPRVFDLFAQEGQAIDRAQGGLGLGLAIVRNLVRLHGGEVSAHSEGRGLGSEFVVRLPRADVAVGSAPSIPPPAATAEAPRRRRVLVVDDNRDAADMLCASLDALGHEARVAYDGPTALVVAATFEADLALLDIGLPVMDGYELGRRLREGAAGRSLRLVAVTGYGQDSDRARSRAAGFDEHLVKPLAFDALAALLARLWRPAP